MELTLPMVVVQHERRLIEAWLPQLPGVRQRGPSLAEIYDDISLAVMERFYNDPASRLGDYQIAPSARIEHVLVERAIHDTERRRRWEVRARVAVLVERWPDTGFLVVTPTRLPELRFALLNDDHLEASVSGRIAAHCLEHDVRSLEAYHCTRRERLELLKVDAIPPTILPHSHPRALRGLKLKKKTDKKGEGEADKEDDPDEEPEPASPKEREERRRLSRLTARVLRQVGRNLSHAADDDSLGRAFGRDGMVDRLVDELATREGAAVVLVGPSGAGKTAILDEFARRLQVFNARHKVRRDIWRVDGNRFIAGMKYVGQWEERARSMVEELTDTGDLLCLDDLASMVQAGRTATGDTNVAQFLAAALAKGQISVIAESTPERLAWAREEAPGFVQLFRVVHVEPMTARAALPVLIGALRDLDGESEQSATPQRLSPHAIEATLQLCERFLPNEVFPGKAVRLLRATLDRQVEVTEGRSGNERRYGPEQVQAALQQRTGLPDFVLDPQKALPRDDIRDRLGRLIAGQPEALDTLSDLIVALQQGLCDPDKPLGTFLFVGPTGVGKTESCLALAQTLFGSRQRLVRFDMSEFTEPYSVTRLIGYTGAPDGELTSALRAQPFCVILFDEIEKAHPRVFDALLQLLGEGRLSDAAGRLSDARQAVIVMTSNLGVREAASQSGFVRASLASVQSHYITAAQRFFRPEFFNRIDRVVPFRPLDPDALRRVVEQQLGELLGRRGITRSNLLVEVEPAMLDALVERAYDPRYGARPLKREMERQLTTPLAHHLVRRRDDDLTLVQLLRLGTTMALRVRALAERASSVPPPEVPTTTRACEIAFARLRASAEAMKLELPDRPPADPALALAHTRLADELIELLDGVSRAEEDPLLNEEYLEEEISHGPQVKTHGRHGGDHNRYRGGLRPRPGFTLVAAQSTPALMLHQARKLLVPLLDGAEILEAQIASLSRRESFCLLLEALPGATGLQSLASLLLSLSFALPSLSALREVDDRLEPLGPVDPGAPGPLARRVVASFEGLALAPVLGAFEGFALHEDERTSSRMVARVRALPGGDPAAAVAAWDEERDRCRQRRRAGEDVPIPDVPDRITFRTVQGRWVFVPAGVPVPASPSASDESRALLAAALRVSKARALPRAARGALGLRQSQHKTGSVFSQVCGEGLQSLPASMPAWNLSLLVQPSQSECEVPGLTVSVM